MSKQININKLDHPYTLLIAKRLKQLRISKGLSRKDMSNILSLTQQQLQKYESGANRISAGCLKILCEYFGLSSEYFFNTNNTESSTISASDRILFKYFNQLDIHIREALKNFVIQLIK